MEAYNARESVVATSLSPLYPRDVNGGPSTSWYEHRPPFVPDNATLHGTQSSPIIKEQYEDRFPFAMAENSHHSAWSPNPTAGPAWYPSEPSPSLLLNGEYDGAPGPFTAYGTDNVNSEYEAQLPWPESDPFASDSNMEEVNPFQETYYTSNGLDGNPHTVCDPAMTLHPLTAGAAGVTPGSLAQQPVVFETSPGFVSFRRYSRQGAPEGPVMPMREAEGPVPASMGLTAPGQSSLNTSSPLSVISPPPSATSSSRKRNTAVADLEKSPVAPKKRVIKPQLTAKVDNSEDFEIQKDSEMAPTGVYQGYFQNWDVARQKLQRLLELYRKPKENCSYPSNDETFPVTDEDKIGYIKNLFDAINDWSNFREWSQALKTEDRNRIIDRLRRRHAGSDNAEVDISLDDMRPSQQELEALLPPLQAQQKKILGRLLSDQTVEWLCWELIEAYDSFAQRVEAMCYALRLVKSLLSAGDGWKLRIANNPQGELGHKGNNMKVNMNKNRKLRQITQGSRTTTRQKPAAKPTPKPTPKQSQKQAQKQAQK
ncbi:hypothetical protein BBK36DRAFT_1168022 [Trichoderma citrinoviride]|uniref:Uncharacterized protein n=1 Tax=Trichoderma citrinoviride TaxID=58853 RepID=A0A2T4BEL5_9HYPO|nr:hypothetical protein BBK36DRAFT_1168022 [Trichoderma citrinoviride]PTB67639.1 hypothetical protein BBK36DRAFT_1168022 [Trichoderma citrinoviride]